MRDTLSSRTLPLIVKVKDFWALLLFVLIIGVLLGTEVSACHARGKPWDEVLVSVGRLPLSERLPILRVVFQSERHRPCR